MAEVLQDLPGGKMWGVDLADLDGLGAFAARVDDELDGVDVLVNNAGIPKRRRTTTMTAADVESVMATNYFSPVRLTLALLPRMIERGSGDIVNVSSMGVHLVAFGVGAYSASKAALELFTEALYVELPGTGVRAHLVVPGTTATEFSSPARGQRPAAPARSERRDAGGGGGCDRRLRCRRRPERPLRHVRDRARRRHVGEQSRRPRTRSSPRCANAWRRSAERRLQVDQEVERQIADLVDAHLATAETPLAVDLLEAVTVVAGDDRSERRILGLLSTV